MKKYEAIVMFYPDVEEEVRTKALDRLKGILESAGSIKNVDEWGLRKLAYLIEYYAEAYYVLIDFEAESEALDEFDRIAKISEPVMRHMVIKIDE